MLDRDETVAIGDEVEFVREIDGMHGRLKASRITFLPKNTIQLTGLSDALLTGKVESAARPNKPALIEYDKALPNSKSTSKQLIEVQPMLTDHGQPDLYVLVKGDTVTFRTECKHENPTNK